MVYDYCIIGGGIVGLSTALKLLQTKPGAEVVVLEKEAGLAQHQTGHNSGVIHAGIYYTPGSLKARLCREGLVATKAFCDRHDIAYDTCGKLIVATSADELQRMEALYQRASANDVPLTRVGAEELRDLEPNICGVGALLASETAIVDYRLICEAMALEIRQLGGEIRTGARVDTIKENAEQVEIGAGGDLLRARQLVICAGAQADRLVRMAGMDPDFAIIPFRGEYYLLDDSKSGVVKHLIYPVPDPELPFLGIHLTRTIGGGVTVGPNAVVGFARENYARFGIDVADSLEMLRFSGFWKMARTHWRHALGELQNSALKALYLKQCQKYCPSLTLADLKPMEAGIRAQAVSKTGQLLQDFHFMATAKVLAVCNAPSPAATSAIPIGAMIVERLGHPAP